MLVICYPASWQGQIPIGLQLRMCDWGLKVFLGGVVLSICSVRTLKHAPSCVQDCSGENPRGRNHKIYFQNYRLFIIMMTGIHLSQSSRSFFKVRNYPFNFGLLFSYIRPHVIPLNILFFVYRRHLQRHKDME